MGARTLSASGWCRSRMLVPCRPAVPGAACLHFVVLLETRVVYRWRPGLLETSNRSIGDAVLFAVHRDAGRLHGRVSLVPYCRPADSHPGVHGVQRRFTRGASALLFHLPAPEALPPALRMAGGDSHLR